MIFSCHPGAAVNVPNLSDIDEVAREWIVRIAGHRGLDPDLLQLACEAAYGSPVEESDDVDVMARALKVVGPFIRQQERVKVAKEILAQTCGPGEQCADRWCPDCIKYRQAQKDAAIARGDHDVR